MRKSWKLSVFKLSDAFRVTRKWPYCTHMVYAWVPWIAKVSEWLEHPNPQKSGFLTQGEVGHQMRSGYQNIPKIRIFEFSSSLMSLELSESIHIASTCSTHEYYGLRKFRSDRNTLTSKNLDFWLKGEVMRQLRSGGGGAKKTPKSWFSSFRVLWCL